MSLSLVRISCLFMTLLFITACSTSQPNNNYRKHGSGNFTDNVYDNRGR